MTTDYKYIEQLLERYWQGETSLEEEQILRAFFSQPQLPAHLASFAPLFTFCKSEAQVCPDERFAGRLERAIPALAPRRQLRPIRIATRLVPLLKAAASVAVVLTIALAAEQALAPQTAILSPSEGTEAVYVRSDEAAEVLRSAQPEGDIQTAALAADSLNVPLDVAPAAAEWSE